MKKQLIGVSIFGIAILLTCMLSGKLNTFISIPGLFLIIFGSIGIVKASNCDKNKPEEKFQVAAEASWKLGFIGAFIGLVSLLGNFSDPKAFLLDSSKLFLLCCYGLMFNLLFKALAKSYTNEIKTPG